MENKKINYIVFDVNGKNRRSYIGNLVATSANQKIFVFNDADVVTEESAFRSFARIRRSDGFTIGPISLTVAEINTENTEFGEEELSAFLENIDVDYTTCRILELSKPALAVVGNLQITVVYDKVDVEGKVLETQAKAEVTAHLYEAVEEIFTEEEYTSIKEEMLPRDLGDITLSEEFKDDDHLVIAQNGATKKISGKKLKEEVVKSVVADTLLEEQVEDVVYDSLTKKEQEYAPRLLNVENNKADRVELQAVASGSPKGAYANLAALQLAIPDGDNNIYITLDNGHWNYFDSVWKSGGVYQSTVGDKVEIGYNQQQNTIALDFSDFQIRGSKSEGVSQEMLEMSEWYTPSQSNEIVIENGIQVLKKRVAKVVYDGSEDDWMKSGSQNYFRLGFGVHIPDVINLPVSSDNKLRTDVRCNLYDNGIAHDIAGVSGSGVDQIFSYNLSILAGPFIYIRDTRFATVEDFQQHLSENNLEVYYNIPEETIPLELETLYVENPIITLKDSEGAFERYVQFEETLKVDGVIYDYIDKDFKLHQRVGVPETIIRLAVASDYSPLFFEKKSIVELSSDTLTLPNLVALYEPSASVLLRSEMENKASNERVDVIEQRVSDLEDDIEVLNNKVDALYDVGVPVVLPQYALDELEATRVKLDSLFKLNTFNFMFVTDTHGNNDIEDKVARETAMMHILASEYRFDCAIDGGDWINNNRDIESVKDYIKWRNELLLRMDVDWLLTQGNHDSNYLTDDGITYPTLEQDFWGGIYRPHSEKYISDLSQSKPLHYFVDYPNQKIRVIVMNAFDSNSDESYQYYGYRRKQVEWLANKALDFSNKIDKHEWAVVMTSHMGDRVEISSYYGLVGGFRNEVPVNNILKSFNLGTTFDVDILDDIDNVATVNFTGDFTNQGAMEVIMWVYGHSHYDILHKPADVNWWYFNSASSHPSVRSDNSDMIVPYDRPEPRTLGTVNEFLFNVISIDRFNRKVKIVRVGAGSDYEFEY